MYSYLPLRRYRGTPTGPQCVVSRVLVDGSRSRGPPPKDSPAAAPFLGRQHPPRGGPAASSQGHPVTQPRADTAQPLRGHQGLSPLSAGSSSKHPPKTFQT